MLYKRFYLRVQKPILTFSVLKVQLYIYKRFFIVYTIGKGVDSNKSLRSFTQWTEPSMPLLYAALSS